MIANFSHRSLGISLMGQLDIELLLRLLSLEIEIMLLLV